jgi:hypothetical protein
MRLFLKAFFSNDQIAVEVDTNEPNFFNVLDTQNQTRGVYCQLGNDGVGLFAIDENLFIFLNGRVRAVRGDETVASYSQKGDLRELSLRVGSENQLLVYTNTRRPISTQFYSEDEEDADFGLWLHNVLSSVERRRIFVKAWCSQ